MACGCSPSVAERTDQLQAVDVIGSADLRGVEPQPQARLIGEPEAEADDFIHEPQRG